MTSTSTGVDAIDASFAVHQGDTSLQIDLQKLSGSKNTLPYARQEFIKKIEALKKVAISVPKIELAIVQQLHLSLFLLSETLWILMLRHRELRGMTL